MAAMRWSEEISGRFPRFTREKAAGGMSLARCNQPPWKACTSLPALPCLPPVAAAAGINPQLLAAGMGGMQREMARFLRGGEA